MNIFIYSFLLFSPTGPVIAIRSQSQDSSPDGSYQFSYETENGISVVESGSPKGAQTPEGQAEVKIKRILLKFKKSYKWIILI